MERDSMLQDYPYYLALNFIQKRMWKNEGNELANSGEHNLIGIAAHVSRLPAETRPLRPAHQQRNCAAKDFIPHKHPDDVCEFPCSHTGMVGSTEYFSKESLPATKHSRPNVRLRPPLTLQSLLVHQCIRLNFLTYWQTSNKNAKWSKEPPGSCCPRITLEQETLALSQPGSYISFETSHSSPTKKISIKYFYWFNNLKLLGLSKC